MTSAVENSNNSCQFRGKTRVCSQFVKWEAWGRVPVVGVDNLCRKPNAPEEKCAVPVVTQLEARRRGESIEQISEKVTANL